jgi:hypothetical protein
MKNNYPWLLLLTITIATLFLACIPSHPAPDVQIFTYPPRDTKQDTTAAPNFQSVPAPPIKPKEEYIERNIVVDERNSTFSIGIPPAFRERTEIIAQKPVDYWFEYLPAEAKLEVNGIEVQRNPFRWETKIGYTRAVTKFEYQITNSTGKDIAYNLHVVPSVSAESVPVVVRQRWIP